MPIFRHCPGRTGHWPRVNLESITMMLSRLKTVVVKWGFDMVLMCPLNVEEISADSGVSSIRVIWGMSAAQPRT